VKNLAKRLKTHLQNGSIYFSRELFHKKLNILGAITVERYDHEFVSISVGYLSAYFLIKR
jgi:hypothetical protein